MTFPPKRNLVVANNPITDASGRVLSQGTLDVFWLRSGGSVYHIWQTEFNNGWSPPTPLGSRTMSEIGVGQNLDGRLELFGVTSRGSVYHIWQAVPGDESSWTPLPDWTPLGAGWNVETPVLSRYFGLPAGGRTVPGVDADGDIELFACALESSDGITLQIRQTSGGWSGWTDISTGFGGVGVPAAVVQNVTDQSLEVFALNNSGGTMLLDRQAPPPPNSNWVGWKFDFEGPSLRYIDVAVNGDPGGTPGRLELFGIDDDQGRLWHMWQSVPGDDSTWNSWQQLGTQLGNQLSQITVGQNQDGRLEVFAVDTGGQPWHLWQNLASQGGNWHDWAPLGWALGGTPANVGYIQVGQNNDGRLEVFSRGGDDHGQHVWQQSDGPFGGWSGWASLW